MKIKLPSEHKEREQAKQLCSSAVLQKQYIPMVFPLSYRKGTEIRLAPYVYVEDLQKLVFDHLDAHSRYIDLHKIGYCTRTIRINNIRFKSSYSKISITGPTCLLVFV